MTEHDRRDLPITVPGPGVASAIRDFQSDFQNFVDGAGAIVDIADAAPDCVTAQVYAAAMHVYSQVESEIEAGALPYLERALPFVGATTPREQLQYRAVSAWARSDFAAALGALEELLGHWPRDVTALKFAEFVLFEAPDPIRHLALMDAVAPDNKDLACFEAMHAFSHELNGNTTRAQELAESAIEMEYDTPWAHHALAHVYLHTGRISEGETTIGELARTWQAHSAGIRAHNAWHLALLHLAAGDVGRALGVYQDRIVQQDPASAFEHTDAISFLWRLELMGEAVAQELWAPIVPFAEERAADLVFPFMNAHYLYALARAGSGTRARAAIERVAGRAGAATRAWTTGLRLLEGTVAFAEGDWAEGVRTMAPAMHDIACVGGSDAQNDLFVQAYLVGLVRSGEAGAARALLASRIGERAPNPQERAWFRQ